MEQSDQKFSLSAIKSMIKGAIAVNKTLYPYTRPVIWQLLILVVLGSTIPFTASYINSLLIDELIVAGGLKTFTQTLIGLLGILGAFILLRSFYYDHKNLQYNRIWQIITVTIELLSIKKKAELEISQHEDKDTTNLMNKENEGRSFVKEFVDRQFLSIGYICEIILSLVIIANSNFIVFLVAFLGSIPEFIAETRNGYRTYARFDSQKEETKVSWVYRNQFSSINQHIEGKLFNNLMYFFEKYKTLRIKFSNETLADKKTFYKESIIGGIIAQTTIFATSLYFTYTVVMGTISIGQYLFLIGAIAQLRSSLSGLFSGLGRQFQNTLHVNDFLKLQSLMPSIVEPKKPKPLPTHTPVIEFKNVSFKYPDAKKQTLSNINLRINPGEKIAIIGVNGSGKTTFVKLLCRIYKPTRGTLEIEGIDSKHIHRNDWYKKLGVLFQDFGKYTLPVSEVIALGDTRNPPDREKVLAAAQNAEAHEMISKFENGYDQMLGRGMEGGTDVSGGQWQRLAIARIFYRDPQIYILDEPTSAVDAEAEMAIFEKFEKLPKDKTVILISHRFSTVRNANRILVFENGTITEDGSHEQLMELNGSYARLFSMQASGYQ